MNYDNYIPVMIPVNYINARQDVEARILQTSDNLPPQIRFAYFNWPDNTTDCIDITVINFEGKEYYHIGGSYYAPTNKHTVTNLYAQNMGNWQRMN